MCELSTIQIVSSGAVICHHGHAMTQLVCNVAAEKLYG